MQSTIIPVKERGRLHANPNRLNSDDIQIASFSPCDEAAVGRDVITGLDSNLVSISVDGVSHTFASAVDYTDVDAVEAAIVEVLKNSGASSEYNVWVKAVYDAVADELAVYHDGQRTINSITDGGGAVAATRYTDVLVVCNYVFSDVGAIGPLVYGGSSVALANAPYAHTGTPATDDATAAQLATDIAAALSTLGLTAAGPSLPGQAHVEATRNDTDSDYDIRFAIAMPAGDILNNATKLSASGCRTEII